MLTPGELEDAIAAKITEWSPHRPLTLGQIRHGLIRKGIISAIVEAGFMASLDRDSCLAACREEAAIRSEAARGAREGRWVRRPTVGMPDASQGA